MENIRILFCDIDGTLLSHTLNQIPASALLAIEKMQENGILVFGCTGRHKKEIEALPLDDFHPDGWVLLNGAYACDAEGDIASDPISKEDITELYDFLKEHPFPVQFMEKDIIWMNMHSKIVADGLAQVHTRPDPIMDLDRLLQNDIYMMVPWVEDAVWNQIEHRMPHVRTIRWNAYAKDCFSSSCGKDIGIEGVLKKYGIPKEQALAIGDAENDIAMMQYCGRSVAMGNADEEVKKYATYVTDDIDRDGFAKAMQKMGLCKK